MQKLHALLKYQHKSQGDYFLCSPSTVKYRLVACTFVVT